MSSRPRYLFGVGSPTSTARINGILPIAIVLLVIKWKLLPDVVAEAVEDLVSPDTFMKKPDKK